jgi:hypothetical protein
MKRSEGEKSKRLSVRLTPEEWDFVRSQAEQSGMVLSDFVRHRMLIPIKSKKKEYREVATQLARLGNNVNQLSRWVNSHKSVEDKKLVIMLARLALLLATVTDELRKIREKIMGE